MIPFNRIMEFASIEIFVQPFLSLTLSIHKIHQWLQAGVFLYVDGL